MQDTQNIEIIKNVFLQDPLKNQLDLQIMSRLSRTCKSLNGIFENEFPIKKLLHSTVLGRLDMVEEILKKNQKLTLYSSTITDLSNRTFYQITAFQYAVWALDIRMWELILKYIDKKSAAEQLIDLETSPKKYSEYGAHYDIGLYITKLDEYIKNYKNWSHINLKAHWCQEIGGAQREFPAWLVYAMCEEGEYGAWVKNNMNNRSFTREYKKGHLKMWFDQEFYGEKLGSSWAAARGAGYRLGDLEDASKVMRMYRLDGRYEAPRIRGHTIRSLGEHDHKVGLSVKQTCDEYLNNLRTNLVNNNTMGCAR